MEKQKFQIETYKYANGRDFHDSLLSVNVDINTINVAYANVSYSNYFKRGKQNDCVMSCESHGCIVLDYKGRANFDHAHEIFNDISLEVVKGETYKIREDLVKYGFSWNRDLKQWER